jgi:hypothetical protein
VGCVVPGEEEVHMGHCPGGHVLLGGAGRLGELSPRELSALPIKIFTFPLGSPSNPFNRIISDFLPSVG